MPIPLWDYRKEYEEEREDLLAGVDKVLRSGQLILGSSVRAFEEAFARHCGTAHGVGVNSGTDALFLALRALGIGPRDEVITVSNTAIPTIAAIVSTGAIPRFVDIDRRTYLMDIAELEGALGPRTRAIVPVHLFGQCADMRGIGRFAAAHGLVVVEDCAQAHGATQHGRHAGSMSEAAAFSFYPTKVLGAFGDAGMVLTARADIADRVRRLRVYGTEGTYYAHEHGFNSRLDELQAELLLRKLARLEGYVARRRALAARYDRALGAAGLILPATHPGNGHTYYRYVVRHPRRDAIVRKLEERAIAAPAAYPWPVHEMKAYAEYARPLPRTESAAREIFSLPLYPTLAEADQDFVCAALLDALRHET